MASFQSIKCVIFPLSGTQAIGKLLEHEIFKVPTDCDFMFPLSVRQAIGKLSEHEIFQVPTDCDFILSLSVYIYINIYIKIYMYSCP